MSKCLIYIHGMGGSAAEAEHYKPLFPYHEVVGFDYRATTPWAAQEEFGSFYTAMRAKYREIVLVANSIGAFFAMHALNAAAITRAYFISPIADMEQLIKDMIQQARVTETELQQQKIIHTATGADLSWDYLQWVREHPLKWSVPTHILYGAKDNLQRLAVIRTFAAANNADVTVMPDGEHWFHTKEQMRCLDAWITAKEKMVDNGEDIC